MGAIRNFVDALSNDLQRIKNLVKAAADAIEKSHEKSRRPTDAFPIYDVIPMFVIHPNFLENWQERVASDVLERLVALQKPIVLTDTEDRIQGGLYALSSKELADFRVGRPLLKIIAPIKIREALGRGGRTKDELEIALRSALAFEVFRRDIELSAIEALEANRRNVDLTECNSSGVLAEEAWVDGVPTKGGGAGSGKPCTEDEKYVFYTGLREEGRKLAVERVAGATRPQEVRDAIIESVFNYDRSRMRAEHFELLRSRAIGPVKLLMRACAHATAVAETKHAHSKHQRAKLEKPDGRRKAPYDPAKTEIMTKREHGEIVKNAFTAAELAEIAIIADIDPNLLCPAHALAWPEFELARKIGRLGRGQDVKFLAREFMLLHWMLAPEEQQPQSPFSALHALLAEFALAVMPLAQWMDHIIAEIKFVPPKGQE